MKRVSLSIIIVFIVMLLTAIPSAFAEEAPDAPHCTDPAAPVTMTENTDALAVTGAADNTDPAAPSEPSSEPAPEAMPLITGTASVENGIRITWTSYPSAVKYRLFEKNRDGIGWKTLADVAATSYVVTGLRSNTEHTYTVCALDASGRHLSGYSADGYAFRYLDAPTLTKAESVYSGIKFSWEPVEGAVCYKAYVKTADGWKGIGFTDQTSFVYTGVQSGDSATFTVRCYTEDRQTPSSYFMRAGITGRYIAVPQITGFSPVYTGTHITWTSVKGAEKYRVFIRKADRSGWTKIADTMSTSYDHTGLTDGQEYTYTVRVLNGNQYVSTYARSGWSNTYYAPPTLLDIGWDGEGYTLQWQKAPGAVGCHLYRKALGGEWELLLHTRKRSAYRDTDTAPDTVYTYMLRYVDRVEQAASFDSDALIYYLNGEPANGTFEIRGTPVALINGKVRQGYLTVDGKTYYYDAHGRLKRNDIVGSKSEGYAYADHNGVCCTSKEIQLAAAYMMKYCTGDTLAEKMKTGFLYMAKNFPYNRTYDHPSKAADLPALAIDMFTHERGNCYRYAACFACVARIAGFRTRVVLGTTVGNPHGWVEVLVDGKWLICDPDAQIPNYGKPDYYSYMMEKHYWETKVKSRAELIINENGVAEWHDV